MMSIGAPEARVEVLEFVCGACYWKTANLPLLHIHLSDHIEGGNYIYHHAVKTAYPINKLVSRATQTPAFHLVDNATQTDDAQFDSSNIESFVHHHAAPQFNSPNLEFFGHHHAENSRTVKIEVDTSGMYDKPTESLYSNDVEVDSLEEYDPSKETGAFNPNDTSNNAHIETQRDKSNSETFAPNKETKQEAEVIIVTECTVRRLSNGRSGKRNPPQKRRKKSSRVKIETSTDELEDEGDIPLESSPASLEGSNDTQQQADEDKVVERRKRKNYLQRKRHQESRMKALASKAVKYEPPTHLLQCHLCYFQIRTRRLMHIHIESQHAGAYHWKCGCCRVPFVSEGDYLHHVIQCKDSWVKCHTCSECNHQKVFLSKKQLLAHLQDNHNNVFPLSCSVCKARIASEFDEREHMSEHNKEILKCRFCEKMSKSVVESEIHMMSHVRDNPYTCYICDREFHNYTSKDFQNFLMHVYTHFDDDGGSYVCELCGESFAHSWKRKQHAKKCLKRFLCKTCGKCFAARSDLRQHENTHDVSKKFVCDQCGKAYAYKYGLVDHVERVHSDTPTTRYTCRVCEKAFKSSSCLDRHVLTHTNVLSYACVYCDKKFRCKSNLKAHTRQHTGTKPYACTKCGLAFTHNVSRKNHEAKCTDGQVSKI